MGLLLRSLWMSYRLGFHELALAEWKKIDGSIREIFKKKLKGHLDNPRIPSAALSNMPNCYKIKLANVGYRLVYRVDDDTVFVNVIAIGKRENKKVYESAKSRL